MKRHYPNQSGVGASFVIIVIAIILVLTGALYYAASNYYMRDDRDMSPNEDTTRMPEPDARMMNDKGTMMENDSAAANMPETKTFTITGKSFSFSRTEIRVKKGDTVKVNFTSTEGFHDWVVDKFPGAKTGRVQTGQSTTAEFIASETGIFEYYCSVGSHRQAGMTGKLIVE